MSLESDIRALKESIIQEQLKSLIRKKNLQCDLCQYKATRKDSLRKHLQNHTNLKVTQKQSREQNKEKERKLNCDNCEKTFTTSASLRKHKTWHTDYPKPFKCNTCGYATHAERILRNHIQIHDGRKYKCEICNKDLNSEGSRKSHIKLSHHEGEKKHKCDKCDFAFTMKHQLKTLYNIHLGNVAKNASAGLSFVIVTGLSSSSCSPWTSSKTINSSSGLPSLNPVSDLE